MIEGVTVKELVTYADERGFFREIIRVTDDFFQEGFGQWSHSLMHTGTAKAWHIHQKQTDWWYVAVSSPTPRCNPPHCRERVEREVLVRPAFECIGRAVIERPHLVFHGRATKRVVEPIEAKTRSRWRQGGLIHRDTASLRRGG